MAFWVSFSEHKCIGAVSPRFTFKEVYISEQWDFYIDRHAFSLPEESLVIPVYYKEDFCGIVLLQNNYSFNNNNSLLTISTEKNTYNVTSAFLSIDYDAFQQLKGDTLFLPLEESSYYYKKRLFSSAAQQIRFPEMKGFLYTQVYLPPPGSYSLYLENGLLRQNFTLPYSGKKLIWCLIYFSSVFFIIIMVIQILTMDLHPSNKLLQLLEDTPPTRQELLLALGLLTAVFFAENLFFTSLPFDTQIPFSKIGFYFLLAAAFFFLSSKGVVSLQEISLKGLHLDRSLTLPFLASFILTAFSTFQLPSGTAPGLTYGKLALSFLFYCSYALSQELFWRFYFQTFLERLWGKWPALILTPLIVSVVFLLKLFCRDNAMPLATQDLLNLFFFLPLTFFIPGYIYYRCRSLLSSTLLHALFLMLPEVLTF